MPAGLPGSTLVQNQANPSLGRPIIMDPLSGPKGSPLDAKVADYVNGGAFDPDPNNISTGALCTGIGIGLNSIIAPPSPLAADAIFKAGFNDDYEPGKRILTYAAPPPPGVVATDDSFSTRMYIGGGRMIVNPDVAQRVSIPFVPNPYTAGIQILAAGNGGSRDAGAGPAFTGFALNMVTAAGAVAIGAAIEAGWLNRTGRALVLGESAFGSSNAASAAPA